MTKLIQDWGRVKGIRMGFLFFCVFGIVDIQAQLFPGLEGEELVNALQDAYTPGQLLTETQVKDTLYARIFIEGDSIHCIYSGLAHDLPPGVDPSQWIYENGTGVNSMNLEHGWPQAKGADQGKPGNRNMHHLYPARSSINSDRGDFPYQEIPDALTQKWYHLNIETAVKPNANIDAYSEFKTGSFEPREHVKGDIARAMFYFWTIYRDDAIQADPLFFDLMKDNLCLWHEEDPVDSFEMLRSERIATYQDGKENPFILDCSLVKRAYCPDLQECEIVALQPLAANPAKLLLDPEEHILIITGQNGVEWRIMIVDITGKNIFESKIESNQKATVPSFQAGIYFIAATDGRHRLVGKGVFLFP